MRVRLCGAGDLDALADLAAGFHASHRSIAPDDYRPDFDAANAAVAFGEVAASAEHLLAVADSGIGLAGYLWGQLLNRPETPFSEPARFLFVHQLYVGGDWRRAKVASALVACGIRYAQEQGATEIMLDVVMTNTPAMAVFGALNFRASGVIMRRPLRRCSDRTITA